MSNEILVNFKNGNTIFIIRRDMAGQVALSNGSAWETYGAGGHNDDDYAVALVDKGGDMYVGDFDSDENIAAGYYFVQAYLQLGDNPSDGKEFIDSGIIRWGENHKEITLFKVLTNKAVQTKSTGKIDYYDDDGQTVILTHTPADSESTIERILS